MAALMMTTRSAKRLPAGVQAFERGGQRLRRGGEHQGAAENRRFASRANATSASNSSRNT
jgi:hypothetical protein